MVPSVLYQSLNEIVVIIPHYLCKHTHTYMHSQVSHTHTHMRMYTHIHIRMHRKRYKLTHTTEAAEGESVILKALSLAPQPHTK